MESYLDFSADEIAALNPKGLGKLLLIRRETMESLFRVLGIGWPDYLRLLSKRLRRTLKIPRVIPGFLSQEQIRDFQTHETLRFVQKYTGLPVVRHLLETRQGIGQFWVCSAHGRQEVIQEFLARQRLPIRKTRLCAMGSVQAKKQKLYELALSTDRFLMLYFDDEVLMGRSIHGRHHAHKEPAKYPPL